MIPEQCDPMLGLFYVWLGLGLLILGYLEAVVPELATYKGGSSLYISITSVAMMFLVWSLAWLAWVVAMGNEEERMGAYRGKTLSVLIGGWVLVIGVATLCRPATTVDLFYYILHGRLGAVHGMSPYLFTPADAPADPFSTQIGRVWFNHTSPYGPLALALFTLVSWIPWPTLWSATVGMKFLVTLFAVGLAPLLYSFFHGEKARLTKTAAIVTNPLFVWLFVLDAHCDVMAFFFLLLAALAAKYDRPSWAGAAVAAACATKVAFLILVPVMFCWFFARSQRGSTVFLATYALLYAPVVWLTGGGDVAVMALQEEFGLGLANFVPRFFWFFHWSASDIRLGSDLVFIALGGALCVLLLMGRWRDDVVFPLAAVCGLFVLTRTFWQTWYSIWYWPLLAMSARRLSVYFQTLALWTVSISLYMSLLLQMRDIMAGLVLMAGYALVLRDRRDGGPAKS